MSLFITKELRPENVPQDYSHIFMRGAICAMFYKLGILLWTVTTVEEEGEEMSKRCKWPMIVSVVGVLVYSILGIFFISNVEISIFMDHKIHFLLPAVTFFALTSGQVVQKCALEYNCLIIFPMVLVLSARHLLPYYSYKKDAYHSLQVIWIGCIVFALTDLFLVLRNGLRPLEFFVRFRRGYIKKWKEEKKMEKMSIEDAIGILMKRRDERST